MDTTKGFEVGKSYRFVGKLKDRKMSNRRIVSSDMMPFCNGKPKECIYAEDCITDIDSAYPHEQYAGFEGMGDNWFWCIDDFEEVKEKNSENVYKKTCQRIADETGLYVASDCDGTTYLYEEKPLLRDSIWNCWGDSFINASKIKKPESLDWKECLFVPKGSKQ